MPRFPRLLPPRAGITNVSSMPAARSPHYRPLPSPRKSTRYVVTRVAGRFEAQGQQRHGPLLSSSWELAGPPSAVVTQCDMAASHPQRSSSRLVADGERPPPNTSNGPPYGTSHRLFFPGPPSPHSPPWRGLARISPWGLNSTRAFASRWFPAPFAFMALRPPSLVDGTPVLASPLAGLATRGGRVSRGLGSPCLLCTGNIGLAVWSPDQPMSLDGTHGDRLSG